MINRQDSSELVVLGRVVGAQVSVMGGHNVEQAQRLVESWLDWCLNFSVLDV